MHFYKIDRQLKPVDAEQNLNSQEDMLIVATAKEAREHRWDSQYPEIARILSQKLRFCKGEINDNSIVGTFCIPSHDLDRGHVGFAYVIENNRIIFFDDTGFVLEKLHMIQEEKVWNNPGIGRFMASFLDTLIEKDVVFISGLEDKLTHLEEEVLADVPMDNFNHTISGYRRKIMKFSNYYLQLSDVSSMFISDGKNFFDEEEMQHFQVFMDRTGRLREETQMLREYSIQIREIYQSNVDMRQNQIMKVLTVVTTVFMPLTLIAGWYGMNFVDMPELRWAYGYPAIIIVSIVIVLICIWIMKKKKFW